MNATEHRAEAERLHGEAIVLQGRGFYDHAARTYCVTMAHEKRLQAKWHERRAHAYRWTTVSLQPPGTMLDLLRAAIGPDCTLYADRYGNIHSRREVS